MTVHQPADEPDQDGPTPPTAGSPAPSEAGVTVQPESGREEPNSLPPVVPEDEEPPARPASGPQDDEPSSLPPGDPHDDETSPQSVVVPQDDQPSPVWPLVPEGEQPNSLPPVVPEDEEPSPLPATEPQEDSDGEDGEDGEVGEDGESAPASVRTDPTSAPGSEPASEADGTDPATPHIAPAPTTGWAMLRRALTPRANRAQLVAGLLCAVLGFALVAQVRQSGEADLGGMRQGDLVRILDETTNRGDALARESADLARERDDLLSGSDRRQAALDALRRQAETQGILTGRLPAEGPGVVVTLTEPGGYIKPITMLNMLEEMRNAGAEAIQLNDQRVTASSAFTGTGGAVVLDGVELEPPYRWIAIGDPDIIAPALQIPGGAMAQVRNNGGKGTVEPADELVVDAVRVVPDPVYATPVAPQGD